MLSTTVSSRHLNMQQHPKLIVKNELVASYGKTVLVVVTAGSLLIGIANGVLPPEQVYNCIGLVL